MVALRKKIRFPVKAIRWPAKMSSKVKRGPAFSSVSLFIYWSNPLLLGPLWSITSVYKVKSAFSPYRNEGEEACDHDNKYAASFLLTD